MSLLSLGRPERALGQRTAPSHGDASSTSQSSAGDNEDDGGSGVVEGRAPTAFAASGRAGRQCTAGALAPGGAPPPAVASAPPRSNKRRRMIDSDDEDEAGGRPAPPASALASLSRSHGAAMPLPLPTAADVSLGSPLASAGAIPTSRYLEANAFSYPALAPGQLEALLAGERAGWASALGLQPLRQPGPIDLPVVECVICSAGVVGAERAFLGGGGGGGGGSGAEGHPACTHTHFHWDCILRWAAITNSCPLCKSKFGSLARLAPSLRPGSGPVTAASLYGAVAITIVSERIACDRAQVYTTSAEDLEALGYTEGELEAPCSRCGSGEREEELLLCDGHCGTAQHASCIGYETVPIGDWFCAPCVRVGKAPPGWRPDFAAVEEEGESEGVRGSSLRELRPHNPRGRRSSAGFATQYYGTGRAGPVQPTPRQGAGSLFASRFPVRRGPGRVGAPSPSTRASVRERMQKHQRQLTIQDLAAQVMSGIGRPAARRRQQLAGPGRGGGRSSDGRHSWGLGRTLGGGIALDEEEEEGEGAGASGPGPAPVVTSQPASSRRSSALLALARTGAVPGSVSAPARVGWAGAEATPPPLLPPYSDRVVDLDDTPFRGIPLGPLAAKLASAAGGSASLPRVMMEAWKRPAVTPAVVGVSASGLLASVSRSPRPSAGLPPATTATAALSRPPVQPVGAPRASPPPSQAAQALVLPLSVPARAWDTRTGGGPGPGAGAAATATAIRRQADGGRL
jgi:hypothetical protein